MRSILRHLYVTRSALISTGLIGVLVFASAWGVIERYESLLFQQLSAQVKADIVLQNTTLESALNSRFSAIQGVAAFVETNADDVNFAEHLPTFLTALYRTLPPGTIRNIAISPNNVTAYVYPVAGNEGVLGYNPLADTRPGVRADVNLAIATRRLVVTGPLELIQGGNGLILRQAVYRDNHYWGLVSIVIDTAPLLEEAQLTHDPENRSIALYGSDGMLIYGRPFAPEEAPVRQEVQLPGGAWLLMMLPRAGWQAALAPALHVAWLIASGFGLLLMFLTYVLMSRQVQLSQAVRARTSDLRRLNSRLQADIAQREQIELALRESEERYRLIADNSTDLIAIFNAACEFVYASPSYEQVLECTPAWLIGQSLLAMVHPDDLATVRRLWSHEDSAEATFRQRHQLGHWCWLEASSRVTQWRDTYYIVCVARDITQRRELEEQLWQAQKMESLGQLAGGVAHDFNNVLTAIAGYTSLVIAALDDEAVLQDLYEIERSVKRAVGFTRRLLTFARRQMIAPRVLNLNTLIRDLEPLLLRLLGGQNTLELALDDATGMVRADPSQLEQVLLNLVVNARDAMPDGGLVRISTTTLATPDAYLQAHGLQIAYVLLQVCDTGSGIDSELLKHIFEPFFTTKPAGTGTGLGLATAYGIIHQHAGLINVTSTPGQGTAMQVYLPLSDEQAEPLPELALDMTLPNGTETLLVVEDEAAVRALTVRILVERGYTVLQAANGREALEVIMSQPPDTIALVLTDVVMPEMDGHELALLLRYLYPAMVVVCMSGYAEPLLDARGWLTSDVLLLHKPFTPADLAQTIRQALDRPQLQSYKVGD